VACALCGATDTERLYTKYGWGIERCRRCSLVYANPRAPEEAILSRYSRQYFWDEYLPAVGAPGGVVDLDVNHARHWAMLRLIRRHHPNCHRLLEVGCGAGLFLKAAEKTGWKVSGLELSASGVEFARDRLGLDVREERAEAMSYPPGTFDVAVMFDVIEHLFDLRLVLEATRRALKPGGLLVVSTPNFDAVSRFALGADWATLSPLEHMYYFTEGTLSRLLEACGFRGVTFERQFVDWGPVQTMNHRYTHAPRHWRRYAYGASVYGCGWLLNRVVQRAGRAEALLCLAVA
jgi:SAM-dependent methyltransferase